MPVSDEKSAIKNYLFDRAHDFSVVLRRDLNCGTLYFLGDEYYAPAEHQGRGLITYNHRDIGAYSDSRRKFIEDRARSPTTFGLVPLSEDAKKDLEDSNLKADGNGVWKI